MANEKNLDNYLEINMFEKIIKYNIDHFFDNSPDSELRDTISLLIKNATNGNLKDRAALINFIKVQLLTHLCLYDLSNENSPKLISNFPLEDNRAAIEMIMPFENSDKLSFREKFEILLYKYRSINSLGYDTAFAKFKEKYSYKKTVLSDTDYKSTNIWYEYTSEDIDTAFVKENPTLNFYEKVDVISQRIYSDLYGLNCIDILSYSSINEVGISDNGKYIYAWADNKIKLSFLELSEQETRIIQNRSISFDDKVGDLNTSNPEVLCFRADNARITALQPPYCSARTLCIRIFDKKNDSFRNIINNKKQQLLLQFLIKVGQKISLQGGLGTGKTTAMQTMLEVLDDSLHIGTVEDYFEQHNMEKYPNKRVIEIQECLNLNKDLTEAVKSLFRLSVDVANVGEARDGKAIFSFIQLAQAIENSAMLTSHVANPEDTIPRFKNMLLASGIYHSEQSAIADIVNYLNIICQHEIVDNVRRITKIVEIIPQNLNLLSSDISLDTDINTLEKLALIQQIQQNPFYMYRLNPIMVFDKDNYRFINYPSENLVNKAKQNTELFSLLQELFLQIEQDIGHAYEVNKNGAN